MKNKLMLTGFAVLLTLPVSAHDNFSGFSLSARGGGLVYMHKSAKKATAVGDLVFCYGSMVNSEFYAGGELNIGYTPAYKVSYTHGNTTVKISSPVGVVGAVSAKLGYAVSPDFMAYITPGVAFDFQSINIEKTTKGQGVERTEKSSERSLYFTPKIGLGMQYAFNENFSVRVDGDYIFPVDQVSRVSFKVGLTYRF